MKIERTIVSRDEARVKGDRFFFTGIPCRHKHLCYRYVSQGGCVQCVKSAIKNYRENNPRYFRDYMRGVRKDRRYLMHEMAKQLAFRMGVKFDLKKEDIIIAKSCPNCGNEFLYSDKRRERNTAQPGLIRLSDKGGYTVSNISVVCLKCRNRMGCTTLQDSTIEDLEKIITWMKSCLNQRSSNPLSIAG